MAKSSSIDLQILQSSFSLANRFAPGICSSVGRTGIYHRIKSGEFVVSAPLQVTCGLHSPKYSSKQLKPTSPTNRSIGSG